ncbi:hypothetical protein INR49_032402 [Caranx melampygus]|nr:hypothetical protein INR49_032402 [Caranx melampygus]
MIQGLLKPPRTMYFWAWHVKMGKICYQKWRRGLFLWEKRAEMEHWSKHYRYIIPLLTPEGTLWSTDFYQGGRLPQSNSMSLLFSIFFFDK